MYVDMGEKTWSLPLTHSNEIPSTLLPQSDNCRQLLILIIVEVIKLEDELDATCTTHGQYKKCIFCL